MFGLEESSLCSLLLDKSEPISDFLRSLISKRKCTWFCIGGHVSDAFGRKLCEKGSLVMKTNVGKHRLGDSVRCRFDFRKERSNDTFDRQVYCSVIGCQAKEITQSARHSHMGFNHMVR